eukprot:2813056-Alexandrium_andersonii.AAC.1
MPSAVHVVNALRCQHRCRGPQSCGGSCGLSWPEARSPPSGCELRLRWHGSALGCWSRLAKRGYPGAKL